MKLSVTTLLQAMCSTHAALYFHAVFGTKHLEPLIREPWMKRLHEYLGGTIRHMEGVAMSIGGVADHVHLLMSLKPTHRLCDIIMEVKRESSRWIRAEAGEPNFAWQDGYGIFTVSYSQVVTVEHYITTQAEHHRVKTFQEEYLKFLHCHDVQYDPRYVF